MTLFNFNRARIELSLSHFSLIILAMPWVFGVALQAQDGDLDTTFSGDGKLVHASNLGGDDEDVITDILVLPDGSIIAAGYSEVSLSGDQDFEIYKFKENGDLDTLNFGPTGTGGTGGRSPVFFDVAGTNEDRAYAIDRDPSGRYIVVGTAEAGVGGDYSVAAARLNVNGTIETTWGTSGQVLIPVGGTPSYDQAIGVEVLSDFSAIVGVYTETGGTASFAFLKLDSNGALDTSFGSSGITIVATAQHAVLRDIAVQDDGSIVGVGEIYSGGDADFLAVRLTAAGQMDTSFDLDGYWTYGFDNGSEKNDIAKGVVVQSDGKILIAGTISASAVEDSDFGLVRLMSNGLLDPSFSGNGLLELSVSGLADGVTDLGVLADGTIFVAGYQDFGGGDNDFAIYKLLSNGSPDTSFGSSGYRRVPFDLGGDQKDRANALDFDSNGKVVLGGFAQEATAGDTDLAFARLLNTLGVGVIFSDGFETGDVSAWSSSSL